MLPTTSHSTERVLDRLAARTRPKRQTPLQPRDKRSQYELRKLHIRYDDEMSQRSDSIEEREKAFATWLSDVAQEKLRLYGWSTDETIERSSIERATWYRWKKISKPGNMPRPLKLDEFCESLGLDPAIPYGILGWGQPAKRFTAPEPEPAPESDLDRRVRLLGIALDRPGIGSDERRELEIQLMRLQAAQQMNDDAIKAADEALKRHGAA